MYDSPVGPLTLLAGPAGIRELRFPGRSARPPHAAKRAMPQASAQLREYFAGERRAFTLDLDLRGTPLQKLVWQRLLQIGHGTTTSYGELARSIDESAYPADAEPYMRARLVGAAVGRTPTPILVPCHRVIGSDGSLTGYGGGLARKRALLELEGALPLGAGVGVAAGGLGGGPDGSVVTRTWTLLGGGWRAFAERCPGALGGHRRSRIYGRLDCAAAARAIARGGYVAHRVFFADESAALAAGHRPCAVCMADAYRKWKAGLPAQVPL